MTRRRPEKRTIVEPSPTMSEVADEAWQRLNLAAAEANLPAAFLRGGPILCGWCQRREGPHAHREHRPCTFYGCECFCRSERSADVTQPIAALLEDPRDGSGVRDAISQDPALAGLLEGL